MSEQDMKTIRGIISDAMERKDYDFVQSIADYAQEELLKNRDKTAGLASSRSRTFHSNDPIVPPQHYNPKLP